MSGFEMDDEKKMCQNCKRDIPSSNYEMHTVHCQRNIKLCPNCEEPIPRSEMEDHKKEFHSVIACPECREKMERSALENHKENSCSHRSVPCQYCDLELKANSIPEHENYCGSRTEDCEECGKIFMLKFRDFHLNSNHRLTQPREEVSSESDNDIVDVKEFFQNNHTTRFRRDAVTTSRDSNHSRRAVPYENNSRRQGRNSLNDIELDEYFGNMGIENIRNIPGMSFQARANHPRANRVEDATYIPCEFCEVPIIADELVLHQTGCRPDLVSHQSPTASKTTESWTQRVRRDNIVHEISDDDDDDVQYIDHERENEVLIPCEFCDRHFSLDAVTHHQITCGNNQGYGHEVYD